MPRQTGIKIKRAYDDPNHNDGKRFLVDGIWPRGVKKEDLDIEQWVKPVAPSKDLRKWFGHDPDRWEEFKERYSSELDEAPDAWRPLLDAAREGTITLVYGARDEEYNNAVALKQYLERRL